MSSGFPGGGSDFFSGGGGGMNGGYSTNQFPFRSPLSGILPDPASQIRRPDLIRKRSLAEFQQQNQQGLEFYLRNVKLRPSFPLSSVSPVDFPAVPSGLADSRYGLPVLHRHRLQPLSVLNRNGGSVGSGVVFSAAAEVSGQDNEKKMMNHRLQELEKELLGDEEDGDGDGDEVSVVTNSEWSDTIQNLIGVSPSPTSSSSSCTSTSASPPNQSTKQSLIDAAAAISEGNPAAAAEILTRLQQLSSPRGSSEQRLTAFMLSALKSRLSAPAGTDHPYSAAELHSKEHKLSTQMLYEVSPCFKLSFMAANLAILNAASEQGFNKIHVVDFEIGEGGQYMHFLHALSASKRAAAVKITAVDDDRSEKLRLVGERLAALADKLGGIEFEFSVKKLALAELSRENLGVKSDEALAVNLAFSLHSLPDESVTTENPRDALLRHVKGLAPAVATVVEQEVSGNTAALGARVRECCEHYGAVLESLEATVARGSAERAGIEEAVGRKIGNAVACEGRERVERCEVQGKWRARMGMAGFGPVQMGRAVADSLRGKLNSGTRGNPGFTVAEQAGGGVGFGWKGRTITVASAWR